MIRVSETVFVKSERLTGSWTRYRVWIEQDGEIGAEIETDDPETVKHRAAEKLRVMLGLQTSHKIAVAGDGVLAMLVQGMTSPWFWFAILGLLFAR